MGNPLFYEKKPLKLLLEEIKERIGYAAFWALCSLRAWAWEPSSGKEFS